MKKYKIWAIIEEIETTQNGETYTDLDETTTNLGEFENLNEAKERLNDLEKEGADDIIN